MPSAGWVAAACALSIALSSGCQRSAPLANGNAGPAAHPVENIARDGGVTLRLAVDESSPTFDQHVTARIEVEADSGIVVRLEDYALALDRQPFGYRFSPLRSQDAVADADGRKRWVREYRLTFLVPGEHTLPAAALTYFPVAEGDDAGEERKLQTEPMTLTVRTTQALAIPAEQLGQLEAPAPVDLPEDRRTRQRWLAALAAVALAALVLGAWWWRRRRARAAPPAPPVPADVWALRELDSLLAARLIEQGRVQEFYFRLSAIVRQYIERQFAVQVPEMTTEEFLQAALAGRALGEDNQRALGTFLEACDLVKFARHQPASGAIEHAAQTARAFIVAMGRPAGTNHQAKPQAVSQEAAP